MEHIEKTIEEYKGHSIGVTWHYDEFADAPWESDDGHGPVSDWTRRDKEPGERVLCSDRNSNRYYDFAEAIKIAKREQWDAPPYKTGTKGQQALRAVERDFEYLRAWCNNDWYYVGRIVTVGGKEVDSCWGFESESMAELTKEGIGIAQSYIDAETADSFDAACRDIATVTP